MMLLSALSAGRKDIGPIVENKINLTVSRERPTARAHVQSATGKTLELQINYRPMGFLARDHWIVQFFETTGSSERRIIGADLFNNVKSGEGGDSFSSDGRIRYLYPEDSPPILFNKTKLITEGRTLFLDPLKRPRIFVFDKFKSTVAVRSVEMEPSDLTKVSSMDIDIRFENR